MFMKNFCSYSLFMFLLFKKKLIERCESGLNSTIKNLSDRKNFVLQKKFSVKVCFRRTNSSAAQVFNNKSFWEVHCFWLLSKKKLWKKSFQFYEDGENGDNRRWVWTNLLKVNVSKGFLVAKCHFFEEICNVNSMRWFLFEQSLSC